MEDNENATHAFGHAQARMLVGAAFGFLTVVALDVASADETPTSAPVEPDLSVPAVVVSAGTDALNPNTVTQLAVFGHRSTEFGTAVNIGDDRLVTVAHALVDARAISVGDTVSAPSISVSRTDLIVDPRHDLATFRAATPLQVVPLADAASEVGDTVALAGFGGDQRLAVTTGEVIYHGAGAPYGVVQPDIYVIGAQVQPGWSGGPVVNADGELVAVIIGAETTSGTTIAVPVVHAPRP